MAAGKLTDAERVRILELHGEGVSRNAIAREVGRSVGSVTNVVTGAGRTFERSEETVQATRAAQQDNAAKRAALETRLLDKANDLLDDLDRPHVVFNFGGKENTYEEHTFDRPDVAAKSALVRTAGVAIDKAIKLAGVDAATTGAAEGKSMLGDLAAAMQAAYDALPEDDGEGEE